MRSLPCSYIVLCVTVYLTLIDWCNGPATLERKRFRERNRSKMGTEPIGSDVASEIAFASALMQSTVCPPNIAPPLIIAPLFLAFRTHTQILHLSCLKRHYLINKSLNMSFNNINAVLSWY